MWEKGEGVFESLVPICHPNMELPIWDKCPLIHLWSSA